ncbi:class II aldolase/adducin family protein [Actinomadura sp. 6N118]|uniref:class II aldolase/adducin family protein n=1 Tax=Actinomadura sp. 6N118 TaxID=3375151 RepID=UPI00379B774D
MTTVLPHDDITAVGAGLSARGLTPGSTGNISVRADDGGVRITPTGAVLGALDPADVAVVDEHGHHTAGRPPSKELGLHDVLYREHPSCAAIVHVHSLHAVAVSCLARLQDDDPLPRLTPYYVAKVPQLRLVPYHRPGSLELVAAVAAAARRSRFLLLRNHGTIVAAPSLREAADAVEEIEQTAALALLLDGRCVQTVGSDRVSGQRSLQLGSPDLSPGHTPLDAEGRGSC